MTWWDYLTSAASYGGEDGITHRMVQHLTYTGLALLFTCLIALPLGLALGHARRGAALVIGLANLGRAIPTFGILVVFAVSSYGVTTTTLTATLVLFAIPPVLTNTFTGVASVEADVVEAARGMGMSGRQILVRTEVPLALPLIAAGIRSAAVQVVATLTIAAYTGSGGLGAIVFRGYNNSESAYKIGGAVLVVLLALVVQAVLSVVQRAVTPVPLRPGGASARRGARARAAAAAT